MRALAAAAVLVLAGASTSCSGADRAYTGFAVRDSAGITIVENTAPTWSEADRWRLSDEPTLVIGVAEGPEEYQLFRARSALHLSTGEIVVANAGTSELRFYDSRGTFLRAAGREGDGPGEFRRMHGMWRLGPDSLMVYDWGGRRVSVLTAQGLFARSFRMGHIPEEAPGEPVGLFADRTVLASSMEATPPREPPAGLVRHPLLYARFDPEGALIDTLPTLFGWEGVSAWLDGRWLEAPRPWARSGAVAVGRGRWYYGTSERWEIETYSPDGRLTGLIRRATHNRPVTSEMVEGFRRAVRAGSHPIARIDLPLPETMPAYTEFRVDDDGNLWVAEYTLPDEAPSWAVFDPEGRFLGTVATPAGGQVTHIGTDFVLGIWQDEMDVERVRMYGLIKP